MKNLIFRMSFSSCGMAILGLIFSFFISCGPQKEKLPTDMVGIPGNAQEGVDRSALPEIKFTEQEFDFGTITQGEKVSHEFEFENIGAKDLIISNAYADCGCTVAEVPEKPIAPGEKNIIRVAFDSNSKSGIVTKSITVVTNCIPNKQVVKIKANIFVPKYNKQ